MRPAYAFALASAAVLLGAGALWWWAATGVDAPPPPQIPAAAAEALHERGAGDPATGEAARPPTREEALEAIQQAEEAELGPREAERRRRLREQVLEARARHLQE